MRNVPLPAFALLGAAQLLAPWIVLVRITAVVFFLVVVYAAVLRPWSRPSSQLWPSGVTLRVYRLSVPAELLAIPIGIAVIANVLHRPSLTLPWVVLVVGAHFIPFAHAFGIPRLVRLGLVLIVVALVAGIATIADGAAVAAWTSVVAGGTRLAGTLASARRSAPSTGLTSE
ncbi:MAG: hypothetical protein ABI355_17555 [Solirubrobacteraceae bacterium]